MQRYTVTTALMAEKDGKIEFVRSIVIGINIVRQNLRTGATRMIHIIVEAL